MIEKYLKAANAIARELKRGLVSLDSFKNAQWFRFYTDSMPVFQRADELTARVLRDAQLAGWVDTAENIFRMAGIQEDGPPAAISLFDYPHFTNSPVSFEAAEKGANYLAGLRAFTRDQFDSLDADARRVSFTVARVATAESVERVRDLIADAQRYGRTYRQVRPALREAVDSAPLSAPQLEAIFRTYVGRAQAAGALDSLNNPMVRDEFPYRIWSATHDARAEQSHKDMEHSGLDGTAIYRADDPIWTWAMAPVRWNCRCNSSIPISIEDAARYGVREAIKWMETGIPPVVPTFVKSIPLKPVKGWVPTGGRLLAV